MKAALHGSTNNMECDVSDVTAGQLTQEQANDGG